MNEIATGVGMDEFMTDLTTGMSAANLWGAILPLAGFIVIVTLFALGRRVLNKNLTSAKSGRAGKV